MYEQPYNTPYMVHDDGTNSPLDHQRVISKLTVGLGILFYRENAIPFEPLPETPLGEGPGHQVPDVLLFDDAAQLTRVIIEIAQPRTAQHDIKKVIRLIEDDDYGILEGFVFNYKSREWFRYRKGDGGVATASSYSEVMGVDMGPMV